MRLLAKRHTNTHPTNGDSKTKKTESRTVSGVAFLRLVLQHMLPKGFRRSRNYGFLHPNSKRLMALLRLLVFRPCGKAPNASATVSKTERPKLLCRCCGGVMLIVRRRILPVITDPPGVGINGEGVASR